MYTVVKVVLLSLIFATFLPLCLKNKNIDILYLDIDNFIYIEKKLRSPQNASLYLWSNYKQYYYLVSSEKLSNLTFY